MDEYPQKNPSDPAFEVQIWGTQTWYPRHSSKNIWDALNLSTEMKSLANFGFTSPSTLNASAPSWLSKMLFACSTVKRLEVRFLDWCTVIKPCQNESKNRKALCKPRLQKRWLTNMYSFSWRFHFWPLKRSRFLTIGANFWALKFGHIDQCYPQLCNFDHKSCG